MLFSDLAHKVDYPTYYNTVHNKLNDTFVKYKGWWYFCLIALSKVNQAEAPENHHAWITLRRAKKDGSVTTVELTTLDKINIEPEWPRPGKYYCHHDHSTWTLKYKTVKSYKAALPNKVLSMTNLVAKQGTGHPDGHVKAYFLNAFERGTYPTLPAAVAKMTADKVKFVPLTKNLSLASHPYVNGPVIYYKKHLIGLVAEDLSIKINSEFPHMEEYLKHIGTVHATE